MYRRENERLKSYKMKVVPRISGIWKRSIQREAIAQINIVPILLIQALSLSLVTLRKILPPCLEQGGVREQFFRLFHLGLLVLGLDICIILCLLQCLLLDCWTSADFLCSSLCSPSIFCMTSCFCSKRLSASSSVENDNKLETSTKLMSL